MCTQPNGHMGKSKALETALNNKLLGSHEHLKKYLFSQAPTLKPSVLWPFVGLVFVQVKLLVNKPRNLTFLCKEWIYLWTRFLEVPYEGGSFETLS